MPAHYQTQYQVATEPVLVPVTAIFEPQWHQGWSAPVRQRVDPRLAAALAASGLFFVSPTVGETVSVDKWFARLSEPPVKTRARLAECDQQAVAPSPLPLVSFAWFNPLAIPRTLAKSGIGPALQQAFTTDTSVIPLQDLVEWFVPFSDPVRVKPGLWPAAQQFLAAPARLLPTPTIFGILAATETRDSFLGGGVSFARPVAAKVGLIEQAFAGIAGLIETSSRPA